MVGLYRDPKGEKVFKHSAPMTFRSAAAEEKKEALTQKSLQKCDFTTDDTTQQVVREL
jgi:hypothetical protein